MGNDLDTYCIILVVVAVVVGLLFLIFKDKNNKDDEGDNDKDDTGAGFIDTNNYHLNSPDYGYGFT